MKKGFTIIELIIVLTVLIILIGIIVPRIGGMQQQGNMVKVKSELQTLQSAIESYYANETSNPKLYPVTSATPCADYFIGATPGIIGSVIYDAFNPPAEYKLFTSSNGLWYAFASVGVGGTSFGTASINDSGLFSRGTGTSIICVTNGTGC
ncbi:MAG: type II secretion system protein [Candidatus Omnitrophica bacterium]|nr:type II secretion system protein [Candidatus Omnitrophota bacterium]